VVLSEFVFDTMDQAGFFVRAEIAAPTKKPSPEGEGRGEGLSEFVFETMDQVGV
jgi:hypothetical protein